MTFQHPSGISRWRANFLLAPKAQLLAELWGMEAPDFAKYAIFELVKGCEKEFGNIETYCVAHFIRSHEEWRTIAQDCDDYMDFLQKLSALGIHETPKAGIKLRDRRIARGRLNPMIREIRKDVSYAKKKEKGTGSGGLLRSSELPEEG